MKTVSMLTLGAAMFATTMFAAPSQAGSASNFAFINGDRVLETSAIGQGARETLEASMADWTERLTSLNTEIETLTRQRQEQALTLNEAALSRLNEDIAEKEVQLDRMNEDAQRDLARMEQQVTLDVNSLLGPLVEQFAADNGYEMIFDTARLQGILYFAPSKDVTDDFIAVVNASGAGTR